MNANTLEALKGSIAKWEAIVAGTGIDEGDKNCPLCQAFANCDGCPVAEMTEQYACEGTPYYKFRSALDEFPGKAVTKKQKKLAQAELDFLRSLLPSEAATFAPDERTP